VSDRRGGGKVLDEERLACVRKSILSALEALEEGVLDPGAGPGREEAPCSSEGGREERT